MRLSCGAHSCLADENLLVLEDVDESMLTDLALRGLYNFPARPKIPYDLYTLGDEAPCHPFRINHSFKSYIVNVA